MTKITDVCFEATGRTCFVCDFSPPRAGDSGLLARARVGADFVSVAHNPGQSVRVDSAMFASAIKAQLRQDVVFTVATRDMNKLALQSHLLGAQLLGLENVIVLRGDPFGLRDLEGVADVGDFTPSALIGAIAAMNQGVDFRRTELDSPTDFCVGAAVDLGRDLVREVILTQRKVQAGAQFLITQPIFDPERASQFRHAYGKVAGGPLGIPVFFGLQLMEPDGISFSAVPQQVREELADGRCGVSLALELCQSFHQAGLRNVYLVPSIAKGGARNYEAAREFLAAAVRD